MKILLAVDGSEFSDTAVAEVASRPWPEGSEIRVLTVIEPVLVPTTDTWVLPDHYYQDLAKAEEEQARAIVDKAVDQLGKGETGKLPITTSIAKGYPRQAILEEADRWEADLIAVGSHGYRGFTRFLLGSVSQAVAAHANCSVEIVRKRRPESAD